MKTALILIISLLAGVLVGECIKPPVVDTHVAVQATQNACDEARLETNNLADCYITQSQYQTEYLCKDITKIPYKATASCWVEVK